MRPVGHKAEAKLRLGLARGKAGSEFLLYGGLCGRSSHGRQLGARSSISSFPPAERKVQHIVVQKSAVRPHIHMKPSRVYLHILISSRWG